MKCSRSDKHPQDAPPHKCAFKGSLRDTLNKPFVSVCPDTSIACR